jgi:hypothetical protein
MRQQTKAVDNNFQAWLKKVRKRPISQNPITCTRIVAKEVAEGMWNGWWKTTLRLRVDFDGTFSVADDRAAEYFKTRVSSQDIALEFLIQKNYLKRIADDEHYYVVITENCLDLLEASQEIAPSAEKVFISYSRKESSPLSLLVLNSLKRAGIDAFLDLALVPGEAWHAGLQERIKSYDAFILLLAPETLTSEYVIREIEWALDAGVEVIPLWHGEFAYDSHGWRGKIPDAVDGYLARTHAIRVLEESASGYNTAIVELLNRFGVTPD